MSAGYWQTALGSTGYDNAVNLYNTLSAAQQRFIDFASNQGKEYKRTTLPELPNMPIRRKRRRVMTPARKAMKRRYKKKWRRRRRQKGGERRMKKGGRKLRLMTQIIPRETVVKLPYTVFRTLTFTGNSANHNYWRLSLQNTLYWPLNTAAAVREQQVIRGADAWASFYRKYQVLGIKWRLHWLVDGGETTDLPPYWYILMHVGKEKRVDSAGTASVEDFRYHKNTRISKTMCRADAIQATAKGQGLSYYTQGYISHNYLARQERNPSDTSAETGLPATAGADGTDPAYAWYLNLGVCSDGIGAFTNGSVNCGRLRLSCTYYVRFFDRKYFQL